MSTLMTVRPESTRREAHHGAVDTVIRRATTADGPRLVDLSLFVLTHLGPAQFRLADPDAVALAIRQWLVDPATVLLVAEQHGQLVGVVRGVVSTPPLGGVPRVTGYWIEPTDQDVRVRLRCAFEQWAQAQDATRMTLAVLMCAPTGETKAVPSADVPYWQAKGAQVI